jgi:hypothetical protein
LEKLQGGIDPAFVGDNDAQRIRRLPAGHTRFAHFGIGQAETDVVVFERAMADEDRIAQGALAE